MATQDIVLTTEWVQVTDGTQTVLIQVMGGMFYFRDSPTKPDASQLGHLVNNWIGVTPPQQAWCRAHSGKIMIVVT